ncbi:MAG: hypothetical protein J6W39_01715 [Spirochaetales bacterium]|nr:hypothetical protein [Spirochaetales bacterium]
MLIPGIALCDAFNVLVYPSNAEISSYVQSFFPTAVLDSATIEAKQQRKLVELQKENGEKLSKEYKGEDSSKIKTAKSAYLESEIEKPENPFEVKLVSYGGKAVDTQVLVSGDRMLLRYMCLQSGADIIIIPIISRLGDFNQLSLYRYSYASDDFSLIFERLSADSDYFTESSVLRFASSFIEGRPSLIRLDNLVDGAYVVVDDKDVTVLNNYVFTTAGKHVLEIGALGHSTRYISINAVSDAIISFDAKLPAVVYSDLLIETNPSSTVKVNGLELGQTPIVLNSYSLPLTLRFEKDQYMGKSLGITENTNRIKIDLKPEWMANQDLLKKSKDRFYWAFARTILLFGSKLALGLFNDGNNKFISSMDIAFNGIITVSIVDAVGCLVDYFRQTEYISP